MGGENGRVGTKALGAALGAIVALVLAAACAGPASAAFLPAGSFAGPGTGDGELTSPGRAAVRQSDGTLFVADTGNNRVQLFSPTSGGATYQSQVAYLGINGPLGVAIDQETDEVYVSDASGTVRLTAALTLDPTFASPLVSGPLAFDQAADELVVADQAADVVRRFERDGTTAGSFDGSDGGAAFTGLEDVAVNAAGDVYVVDATGDIANAEGTSQVRRLEADGTQLATLPGPIGPGDRPARVAVDPSDGDVVVSARQDAVYADQFPTLHFFDASNAMVGETTTSGLYNKVTGLALHDAPRDRLYVVQDYGYYFGSAFGSPVVEIYEDVPYPAVGDLVVSDIAATGATVSATVDPNGAPTTWLVEHSRDGGSTWTEAASGDAGAGEDPVAIEAELVGLGGATDYLVRVTATNGTLTGTAQTAFTTPEGAPTVGSRSPDQITTSGARLRSAVSANGAATSYRFELGSEDCSAGTCSPVSGGGGAVETDAFERLVSASVGGLTPETTYHYRVVAENEHGEVAGPDRSFTTPAAEPPYVPPTPGAPCANDKIREQQGATRLSRCRAYEMVSPREKFNGGVVLGYHASDDGNAAGFLMNTAVGPEEGAYPNAAFASYRGADGWQARNVSPPIKAETRGLGDININAVDFSDDFQTVYVRANDPIDPDDAHPLDNGSFTTGHDLYRLTPSTGAADWLSRPLADPALEAELPAGEVATRFYSGRSRDGSHVVFTSRRRLVPEAPMLGAETLYEHAEGGVRLVAVLPDGTPHPGEAAAAAVERLSSDVRGNQAISADGRRIYWRTGSGSGDVPIYLREDGERTLPVTASRVTGEEGTVRGGTFLGATRDGARVYFSSSSQLTDDAPTDGAIYRWEREGETLTALTGVPAVKFEDPTGYRPVLSESNERLYFISPAALTPESSATDSNLYLWDGELEHVAAISDGPVFNDPKLRVSRDGRYAAFSSTVSLDPAHADGVLGIYRYDAVEDEVVCVSCRFDGEPGAADAQFRPFVARYSAGSANPTVNNPRNITDDGAVYFQTAEPLIAADINANLDVYGFEAGKLELISSGKGRIGSELVDNTDDGSSVFFTTPDALSRRDTDGGYPDVYVARAGGGFPEPPPPPVACSGAGCQLDGAGPPAPPRQATDESATDEPARPAGKALRVPTAVRRRGGSIAIRVRVPAAGKLTVRASRVKPVTVRSKRAATRVVRVALTEKARRQLTRSGSLRVRVRFAFAPRAGDTVRRVSTLTFVAPRKGGR